MPDIVHFSRATHLPGGIVGPVVIALGLIIAACGGDPIAPENAAWTVPTHEARMSMSVDQDSIEWIDNVAKFSIDQVP